jgi:hypothetical protein
MKKIDFYPLGCYQYDEANPLLRVAASHVENTSLTYKSCAIGCSSIGHRFSAIQSMLCFCSNVLPQSSILTPSSNCSSSTCPVIPALNDDLNNFCGTQTSAMIYAKTVSINIRIIKLQKF